MISYLFGHISASQTLFSHRKKKKRHFGIAESSTNQNNDI